MGFVNESFVGNTIDTTGSSTAADLVLAGNQFGVQVLNNTLIGGDRAFWISAYPSETPSIWGWTHAPVLGATISGNTIEDSVEGGMLDVEHGSAVKTNIGRVYLSATLTNNTGIWTAAFLAQPSIADATTPLTALTVGMAPSNDPGELLVAAAGNQVEGPASVVSGPTMLTVAAVVNGQAENNQATVLPTVVIAAPIGLALVNDTGVSGVDGQTSDPDLSFDPVPLAAGYEYSLTGAAGTYQPVTSPDSFLPQGLTAGFNSVFVRAYDANGDRGPDALIEFAYVPDSGGHVDRLDAGDDADGELRLRGRQRGPTVPLGTSIILTAAEEAAAPHRHPGPDGQPWRNRLTDLHRAHHRVGIRRSRRVPTDSSAVNRHVDDRLVRRPATRRLHARPSDHVPARTSSADGSTDGLDDVEQHRDAPLRSRDSRHGDRARSWRPVPGRDGVLRARPARSGIRQWGERAPAGLGQVAGRRRAADTTATAPAVRRRQPPGGGGGRDREATPEE